MDIKKLEYFETLYRLRSFTKASQELYISQPSLSSAIQSLETEMGCSLINRNTRPLSFTPEGERLILHAKRILVHIRQAEEDMLSLKQDRQRTINLSWPSCSITDHLLLSLYTDFREQYPEYQLFCIESVIEDTMEQLLNNSLDLAYVHIPDNYDTHQLTFIPITCCKMYALVSKDHPLADRKTVSATSFQGETIFSFPKRSLYRTRLEALFATLGVEHTMITVNKMGIIKQLVQENRGISFVTMSDREKVASVDEVKLIELEETISFVKGFLFRKDRADDIAIKNLVSFVQRMV